MKKFEGILICTDLDGTLLNSENQISKKNTEAIEHFKAEGGIFTFITGRMPFFASSIYDAVKPNAPFGCINGGGLYDGAVGKYVMTTALPLSVIELVKYAAEKVEGIGVQINHFDKVYFCRENDAMVRFREITGSPNLVREFDEISEPIAKIVFGDMSEESILKLSEVLRSHPRADEFDFIRSEETLFEILPKGINKGAVLPHLVKHLGIKPTRTIAVGDYNNDIGMLREASLGIAVANACKEAKEAADLITVSNDEHAIAKIIYDIESGALKI